MAASRASSGGAAASSQFDNHADHIDNLEATVINTGGTVGSATLPANIGWQGATGTLSDNGRVTVTHHLGWTPDEVFIQMKGDPDNPGGSTSGPYMPYVISPTSTQFTVVFMKLDGTEDHGLGGQAVSFAWLAFKAPPS
jgi:hypothetical protein